MSAGALESGVGAVLERFRRASGHTVTVEWGTAPQLAARMSRGQPADVLVAPTVVVDQAAGRGQIVTGSRVVVGRIGVGVMVGTDAPPPDVSSEAALRRTLLSAEAIVYSQGSSGQSIDAMFARLGIAAQLEARVLRLADADDVVKRVAEGTARDLGFGAITAITRSERLGIRYVAPLPESLQNFTTYEAAVRTGAREPQVASALLQFMATPAARRALSESGVE